MTLQNFVSLQQLMHFHQGAFARVFSNFGKLRTPMKAIGHCSLVASPAEQAICHCFQKITCFSYVQTSNDKELKKPQGSRPLNVSQ